MDHDADNHSFAIEPVDLERVYANYLRTCAMSGVEPVSRERAFGLIEEWAEGLGGARNRPRTSAAYRTPETKPPMRQIAIGHRRWSATVLGGWMAYSAVPSAQQIERPTWSVNDTWTYNVIDVNTYREGRGRFPSTRKVTITDVLGRHYRADVSTTKEYGTRETTDAKWGISFNLNSYERDNATLPWTEMEFLRWPLAVGKSWTFSHPTSDGRTFEWYATVDRWEDVSVPAGRFKAT